MCRTVTCKTCGLTSWAGCGQHVEQVMHGIPRAKRCPGHREEARTGGGLWSRVLGRR